MNSKERFLALRRKVFEGISMALEADSHCKSYEGTLELLISYPNYFEGGNTPDFYQITLHCYVLGPSRQYTWYGKTLEEVVSKAERDIDRWIEEVLNAND